MSSGAVAARSATYSGAAAESTDGLHPATETAVATNSMVAKGNEAVAATVLADQTEEEGDEACHLTGSEMIEFVDRWLQAPFYMSRRDTTIPRGGIGSRRSKGGVGCGTNRNDGWARGDFPPNYIIIFNKFFALSHGPQLKPYLFSDFLSLFLDVIYLPLEKKTMLSDLLW